MNKLAAASLIAGSVVGAAGVTWAMTDKNVKKRIVNDSTKAIKKAGRMMEGFM